jgi:hypothetical protein
MITPQRSGRGQILMAETRQREQEAKKRAAWFAGHAARFGRGLAKQENGLLPAAGCFYCAETSSTRKVVASDESVVARN